MNNTTQPEPPDLGTGKSQLPEPHQAPATQPSASQILRAQCAAVLLTKAQFAERIGVCPRSIDSWCATKKIPFLRITSRLIRIPWPEALDHLNRKFRVNPRGE